MVAEVTRPEPVMVEALAFAKARTRRPAKVTGGRWVAKVIIEQHHGGSVHFQPVSDAPEKTYPTREEAEEASIRFGQGLLDSRK